MDRRHGIVWHTGFVGLALLGGCAPDPGPFYRCPVLVYELREYIGTGCECDDMDPRHYRVTGHGSLGGAVAPPGSFPPGSLITVANAEGSSDVRTLDDGSAFVGFARSDDDMTGDTIELEVAGERYGIRGELFPLEGLSPVRDSRFPEGAFAIESPEGTILYRARVARAPVDHLVLWGAFPVRWIEGPLSVHAIIEETWPGMEGSPIGAVSLHTDGRAGGCWDFRRRGPRGQCRCSNANRIASMCRFEEDDAGPDAGPIPPPIVWTGPDAGPPDAPSWDANEDAWIEPPM